MNEKRPAPRPDDKIALDPNTTFDIVANYNGSVTEFSDTVDAMDGAETKVIEIVNRADGTSIELTVIEEPSNQPGIDNVDRFVRIEGIGPQVAGLLLRAGIKKFSQLAETPAEQILNILSGAGTHYRIHDATHWQQQALQLAADTQVPAGNSR